MNNLIVGIGRYSQFRFLYEENDNTYSFVGVTVNEQFGIGRGKFISAKNVCEGISLKSLPIITSCTFNHPAQIKNSGTSKQKSMETNLNFHIEISENLNDNDNDDDDDGGNDNGGGDD